LLEQRCRSCPSRWSGGRARCWPGEEGRGAPRSAERRGESSGVFGFAREFTGGELQPAGAVAVVNGRSRGGEGEG
jgi:hypothetical protein